MNPEVYEIVASSADRESWLERRGKGLGASDMASVLGCGFVSPAELWAEKTGREEPRDLSDLEWIEWGLRLEPIIIAAYSEPRYAGRPASPSGTLLRSKTHPWALATLDATTVHPVHGTIPLEVKKWSAFAADAWAEGPPEAYRIQVHAQMLVTGAPCASIACLIGGDRFVWCDVERDEATISRLVMEGRRFWDLVERDEMPPPDGSPEWARVFRTVKPEAPDTCAALGEEARTLASRLELVQEVEKSAKSEIALIKNQLIQMLGSAPEGRFDDGTGFTFRKQTRAAHMVAESTFHVLRKSAAPKSRKKRVA